MKSSLCLWRQWSAQLRQLLPGVHGHRTKTLAFFVLGLILAGSTRLPRVAEAVLALSDAKTPSIERRLARFLANEQIKVAPLWTTLLSQVLGSFRDRRLFFVLDCTPLGTRASVLYLGVLVHSRLLPVSWQVMPLQEPWEERQWAIVATLLDRVIPHLGTAECTLLADRGLAGLPLVQLCQARHWHYLLRVSSQHTYAPQRGRQAGRWHAFADLVSQRGQQWFGPALVWQEYHLAAYVSAVWEADQREPWFLLSDQAAGRQRVREYRLRMRVEATFEDCKRRGWDIEGTVITERARLDRLLFVMFLALWWVTHLAAACGQRDRFERYERQEHLSAGTLVALRHLAPHRTSRVTGLLLTVSENWSRLGLLPPVLNNCQGESLGQEDPGRLTACDPETSHASGSRQSIQGPVCWFLLMRLVLRS